jgi:uncharacterized protein (TIGR04222 family)
MSSDLLRRVEEFAIDGPEPPALPFAARLARENGWTRAHADRVVREYKRFAYLAAAGGHPVCPSEDVDQAWHLHLTYTHSYWKRFCGEVLGQPLHHNPTRGGPAEAEKHRRMYDETLAAYRRAFRHEPPPDIWPPTEERFAPDRHVRVDRAANWVIPKAAVRKWAATGGLTAAAVVFATGCGNGLDPFELNGAWYLAFLIPTLVAALVAGLVIRRIMRKPDPDPSDPPPVLSWSKAAYLAGGPDRLLSAAIAKLYREGHLKESADGKWLEPAGPPPDKLTPAEEAVLAAAPLNRTDRNGLKRVRDEVAARALPKVDKLTEAGLLLTPAQARAAALASAVPLGLVILLFGVTRLLAGLSNGKPVTYLVFTLIAATVAFFVLAVRRPTRSRKGDDALDRLRKEHALLKHAKTRDDDSGLPLAIALFGTAVLAGSGYAALRSWYPRQTDTGGSGCGSGCGTGCGTGGGGGGDGGGGGCGSGCGGCGGGGD